MPKINTSDYGYVTIDNIQHDNDVYILVDGTVEERPKSHEITKQEIEYIAKDGPEVIVIGKGTSGVAALNEEASQMLEKLGVEVIKDKTQDIRDSYNQKSQKQKIAAIIHTTC